MLIELIEGSISPISTAVRTPTVVATTLYLRFGTVDAHEDLSLA
jgi:hypothetical protein